MACLIEGLKFITLIPDEVYYFSDELIQSVQHLLSPNPNNPAPPTAVLERPSPNPPQFAVTFESNPTAQLPCLLVNIGSGVSIIKVDEDGRFERVSGTSLGGGTLWGLLSLLTPATSFDEMLKLSEAGDNAAVDMLVGDIYGQDYSRLGLKSTIIASSFGKVFKKGREKSFSPEDISKSLLYAVSNNIGQIAYMNAEKLYASGAKARNEPYSFDMKDSLVQLEHGSRQWHRKNKRQNRRLAAPNGSNGLEPTQGNPSAANATSNNSTTSNPLPAQPHPNSTQNPNSMPNSTAHVRQHPQTLAQQILMSAADRWGLLGLLAMIKNAGIEVDGGLSSIGQDLGIMGLDMGYAGSLYSTFITHSADQSAAHTVEPDYHIPGCYNVQPPPPGPSKATAFSDETLFFIFYSSPRDALQEVAAQELYVDVVYTDRK
ncbi:hypothetical protein PQX77_009638 [Marasmius sp. AFHP31]|nr:hypothetical protein PQX77_009638 [Marasmius sp. AFHP31]